MQTETANRIQAVLEMLGQKVELKAELVAQGRPFAHVDAGIERMLDLLEGLGVSHLMIQDARVENLRVR